MKILFLTYHFAPFNHIGAVRTTKTAKYLLQSGHEVRVLAAAEPPLVKALELEVEPGIVQRVACPHLDRAAHTVRGHSNEAGRDDRVGSSITSVRNLLQPLYRTYQTAFWYPDNVRLWRRPLRAAAVQLAGEFRPDVIFASAPPFTPLLVAAELSAAIGAPWVCELRDLWTDNHNYPYPNWRRELERKLERRVLGSCAALVTVSEPLANQLRCRYPQRVVVVRNGYDPDDYDVRLAPAPALADATLNIVYTGNVYQGKQDIDPLLKAMHASSSSCPVRLHLFGRRLDAVRVAAARVGVEEHVHLHGEVPHKTALAAQRGADLLLLLLWNDDAERGIYTGKLFEYVGARRPILAVGRDTDVAADLVRSRGGYVLRDPAEIAELLRQLSATKLRDGSLPDVPFQTGDYSRRTQVGLLAELLEQVVGAPRSGT